MPGIIDLPGWIWRRLSPVAKVGLVVALVALIGVGTGDRPRHPGVEERARAGRAAAAPARPGGTRGAHTARAAAAVRGRPAATSGVGARGGWLDRADRSRCSRTPAGGLPPASCAARSGAWTASPSHATSQASAPRTAPSSASAATPASRSRPTSSRRRPPRRTARSPLPPADRLRHRALRVLQDRRPPGEGQLKRRLGVTVPAVCGGGHDRDPEPPLRRAGPHRRPAGPLHDAGSRTPASTACPSRRRWPWPRPPRRERHRRAWS